MKQQQNLLQQAKQCLKSQEYAQAETYALELKEAINDVETNPALFTSAVEALMDAYIAQQKHDALIELAITLEEKLPQLRTSYPKFASVYYKKCAQSCFYVEQYEASKAWFYKEITHCESFKTQLSSELALAYYNVAIQYYRLNQTPQSLEYTHKSLNLKLSLNDTNKNLLVRIYGHLGNCYSSLSLRKKQLRYYQKALHVCQYASQLDPRVEQIIHYNLAHAYSILGNVSQSLQAYQELLAREDLEDDHVKSLAYMGYGNLLVEKQLEEGLKYLHIALPLVEGRQRIQVYRSIGVAYLNAQQFQKSWDYLKKGRALAQEIFGSFHHLQVSILSNMGGVLLNKGEYEQALSYFQKGLGAFHPSFQEQDISQNPPIPFLLQFYDNFVYLLSAKAETLTKWYQQTQQKEYLEIALATYDRLFSTIQQKMSNDIEESSRIVLLNYQNRHFSTIYEQALSTALLSETTKFFDYYEQNKAIVLAQGLNEKNAIPEAYILTERQCRKNIAQLEVELFQLEGMDETLDQKQQLETALFEAYQTLEELISQMETEFPEYRRLKYQSSKVTLPDLQSYLQYQNRP
ncbi:MAG: tetratricopeptide repeat protein, partial [Chitinophagales bacterium]